MNTKSAGCIGILFILTGACFSFAQEKDVAGSRDHPLLTRLDHYFISEYLEEAYAGHEFYDEADNEYVIEGRKWTIDYTLKEGHPAPGQLKVFRNHIDALKKIGGEVLYDRGLYMKVSREDKEFWVEVWASDDGSDYRLTIVEKTVMGQEVTADPEAMADDILKQGHVAVYGIYFDFDSASIKPESELALQAIADLMGMRSDLKVFIVGHTDMSGKLDYNLELSRKRADAVVHYLIDRHGLSSDRLLSQGVGPLAPVATNTTEEGRKLNRRVELVAR